MRSINDDCAAYDRQVSVLFDQRLLTDKAIYEDELKIAKFSQSLLDDIRCDTLEAKLNTKINDVKVSLGKNAQELIEFEKEVQVGWRPCPPFSSLAWLMRLWLSLSLRL